MLSLQQVGTFTDGMTGGRGYLALAAIIVGRWSAARQRLLGCLLFGAADALQFRVQGLRLPVSSYVIQMLPYVVALAVLAGLGRSARLPAAIGEPVRVTSAGRDAPPTMEVWVMAQRVDVYRIADRRHRTT